MMDIKWLRLIFFSFVKTKGKIIIHTINILYLLTLHRKMCFVSYWSIIVYWTNLAFVIGVVLEIYVANLKAKISRFIFAQHGIPWNTWYRAIIPYKVKRVYRGIVATMQYFL